MMSPVVKECAQQDVITDTFFFLFTKKCSIHVFKFNICTLILIS